MSSTLTSIVSQAETIGKLQSALTLAKNGEEVLKYETEESITTRCIRNEFMERVKIKYNAHPNVPHDIMLQLTDKCLIAGSWTHGTNCAWFTGELGNYYYNAFFRPMHGTPKLGVIRLTVDEISHQCLDCS